MLKGDGHWLVQDSAGGVYRVELDSGHVQVLFAFHSGGISGARRVPLQPRGADVRRGRLGAAVGLRRQGALCVPALPAAATLTWASRSVDPEGRTIATAYSGGVVRVLTRCKDGLQLRAAFKPHRCVAVAPATRPTARTSPPAPPTAPSSSSPSRAATTRRSASCQTVARGGGAGGAGERRRPWRGPPTTPCSSVTPTAPCAELRVPDGRRYVENVRAAVRRARLRHASRSSSIGGERRPRRRRG